MRAKDQLRLMELLNELQEEVGEWSKTNFGSPEETPPVVSCVGLAEEVGEVCRAVLKQHQGIRGTWQEWQDEIEKELGDVLIKVFDVAERAGLGVSSILIYRWTTVKERNWVADPRTGQQVWSMPDKVKDPADHPAFRETRAIDVYEAEREHHDAHTYNRLHVHEGSDITYLDNASSVGQRVRHSSTDLLSDYPPDVR